MTARGDTLLDLGRTEEALESYDAAQQFSHASEEQAGEEDWAAREAAADALLHKARALAGLGDTQGAIECCDTVLGRAEAGPGFYGLRSVAERAARYRAELARPSA